VSALAKATAAPSELLGIVESLAAPRQEIEAAFVDVGDSLTKSAGLLDQIASTFEALPRDLDRPELTEATRTLTEVGTRAREISLSFAKEQEDIARLVDVVAQANRPITELRRAIRMMGILAINARVVAASVANLEDSDVFTTDIATLSGSAAKTIAEFSDIYAKLGQEVQKAASARAHFEETHSGTLSELAERICSSLADVTSQRQRSADGSSETVRISRAIGQRVMTAVMALQVGDATRQRVEHIETALTRVDGTAADILGAVAELSAAQLADTIQTLDFEVVEAERALAELAADAKLITARSREVYGAGGAGNSALSRLNQEMRQATAVLRDCDLERRKLGAVAGEVEATVKVLLEHVEAVQDIESNMRLVSLNAAIKCAQLGPDGAALNVIARQLRDLTGETVEAAETAASQLGEAASLALSFSAASGSEAAGQLAQLEHDATAGLQLMDGVETRIHEALDVLGQAGPAVANLLGGASSGFANHQNISEALSDAQLRITGLGQAASHRVAADSPLASLLEGIRKTYTMDAERRIHDAMWGKPAKIAAVAVAADDGFETFDDFGADPAPEPEVEGLDLFDDFSAEPASAPVAADEPLGTVEDDVLFF
jgi:methyl-accepting chemotaxis protein